MESGTAAAPTRDVGKGSTPSPWRSRGKSCGRLTRSAETQGPHFHDPLARCSLALPSFLLLRNDRVGLVAIINYSIFSSLLSGTNTGNDAPRGKDCARSGTSIWPGPGGWDSPDPWRTRMQSGRQQAGRHGQSLPSSRSQSEMRAGDEVR